MEQNIENLFIAKDIENNQLIVPESLLEESNLKILYKILTDNGFNIGVKHHLMKLKKIPLSNNKKYYEFILIIDKKGGIVDNRYSVIFLPYLLDKK